VGVKVPVDILGAVASVGVLAAGAGYAAGKIGEALNPQQAKIAKMQVDAEARIRTSGVPPVYLKP
jgi:hypothetical protein